MTLQEVFRDACNELDCDIDLLRAIRQDLQNMERRLRDAKVQCVGDRDVEQKNEALIAG